MTLNATSILSTLPNGLRVTVKRGNEVASLAVRTAINESGQMSLGGIDRLARTNLWTLVADFPIRIQIGDVLTMGTTPAFVVNAMTSCGNLINRAQVILCEDTVTISGIDIACQIGMLEQDIAVDLGGFLPEDKQGFFVPVSLLPEGLEINQSTPVQIAGEQLIVEKIARDPRHDILCVTCRRRGDA